MAHFAQLRLDFVLLSCAALKTSRFLSLSSPFLAHFSTTCRLYDFRTATSTSAEILALRWQATVITT